MGDLNQIFVSTDFWSALFGALVGALAAFLLEALRRWYTDNTRRQATINLALLSLTQMYTVMKNYHDQVFVDRRATLALQLGREPHLFEYMPRSGIAEQQLRLDFEGLGVLLRSHDPDVLNRLLAAERTFLATRYKMLEHVRLHQEFQRRIAEARVPEAVPINPRDIVGPDLYAQLRDIATSLRDEAPADMQQILAAAEQLRGVATIHFPTRRFVGFQVVRRKDATMPPASLAAPKCWRRALHSLVQSFRRRSAVWPEIRPF